MDERLERALAPNPPGLAVRLLAPVVPGLARTRDQIEEYGAVWRRLTEDALDTGAPTLVVFGDSLAQGIGASDPSTSYVRLVADALRDRWSRPPVVVNLSRSGARIGDVLDIQLPAFHATGVVPAAGICTVGSNDLLRSVRFGATSRRLSRLVEQLPRRVVVATVPDARSVLAKRLNRDLRRAAARHDRPVADVAAALTSWKGMVAGDGFHPNDRGHRLWADACLAAIVASNEGTDSVAPS